MSLTPGSADNKMVISSWCYSYMESRWNFLRSLNWGFFNYIFKLRTWLPTVEVFIDACNLFHEEVFEHFFKTCWFQHNPPTIILECPIPFWKIFLKIVIEQGFVLSTTSVSNLYVLCYYEKVANIFETGRSWVPVSYQLQKIWKNCNWNLAQRDWHIWGNNP